MDETKAEHDAKRERVKALLVQFAKLKPGPKRFARKMEIHKQIQECELGDSEVRSLEEGVEIERRRKKFGKKNEET